MPWSRAPGLILGRRWHGPRGKQGPRAGAGIGDRADRWPQAASGSRELLETGMADAAAAWAGRDQDGHCQSRW